MRKSRFTEAQIMMALRQAEGVAWAQRSYRLSERRAIRAPGVSRSSVRYRSIEAPREPLRLDQNRGQEQRSVGLSFYLAQFSGGRPHRSDPRLPARVETPALRS